MLAFGVCLAWHFWFDCYCFLVWLFKFCIVVVPILLFLRITNFILYCYSKVYLSFNSCPFHKRGKVSILSQHPPLSAAACSTRASVAHYSLNSYTHFTSRFHLLWSTEPPGHSPAEWTDPTLYTPLEDSIASVCPSFTFSTKLESLPGEALSTQSAVLPMGNSQELCWIPQWVGSGWPLILKAH